MPAVFIRSPGLIKKANGSHEVRRVPPRSCAPPCVGLATRLCDSATNRLGKEAVGVGRWSRRLVEGFSLGSSVNGVRN